MKKITINNHNYQWEHLWKALSFIINWMGLSNQWPSMRGVVINNITLCSCLGINVGSFSNIVRTLTSLGIIAFYKEGYGRNAAQYTVYPDKAFNLVMRIREKNPDFVIRFSTVENFKKNSLFNNDMKEFASSYFLPAEKVGAIMNQSGLEAIAESTEKYMGKGFTSKWVLTHFTDDDECSVGTAFEETSGTDDGEEVFVPLPRENESRQHHDNQHPNNANKNGVRVTEQRELSDEQIEEYRRYKKMGGGDGLPRRYTSL